MTIAATTISREDAAPRRGTTSWAWWGVASGVLGVLATTATYVTTSGKGVGPSVIASIQDKRVTYQLGGVLGYLTVGCLLVLAASWRTKVGPLLPASVAARVVGDGISASAAALTLGYGWRLAMALYLPGGADGDQFGNEARWVYYVLNDFGAFIGWLGVVVSAAAMTWLALKDRQFSAWIGVVSTIPVLLVAVMSLLLSIAGFPGVVGPVWLIVAFAGIALSRPRPQP